MAAAGSVFLDEIAEMSADVQPRFLKVLEDKSFRRLGGTTSLRSDARVIVATHQPLTQAVANGTFRADLYYRLQVLTLTIPPLRARPAEILPLAHAFLPRGATLDPSAEAQLLTYEWPGNIRELKNTIDRALILCDDRITVADLPDRVRDSAPRVPVAAASDGGSVDVRGQLAEVERAAIVGALAAEGDNQTRAARRLGLSRRALIYKL